MAALLTDAQRETLTAIVDRLIPADGERLGAVNAGVAGYLDAASAKSTRTARTVLRALQEIDSVAGREHRRAFQKLAAEEKDSVLKAVERHAGSLFHDLVTHVYDGYYTNPDVLAGLAPDAGTPQPRGFPIKPFDPAIVDGVRKLGAKYRAV